MATTKARLCVLLTGYLSTIRSLSPHPVPSGTLYSAAMGMGYTYQEHMTTVEVMVAAKMVTSEAHRFTLTDYGNKIAAELDAVIDGGA